jgi:thiol-disulfide isomerase/thioredoxin
MTIFRYIALAIAVAAVIGFVQSRLSGPGAGNLRPIAERRLFEPGPFHRLDGGTWKLNDKAGDIVLMNFWATWCPPCRRETPALVNIANTYAGRGVAVVGISFDEDDQDQVSAFVKHYNVPYTIAFPPAGAPIVAAIPSVPTTFLLDRRHRIAKTYVGAVRESVLRRDLETVLAERQ